MMRFFTVLMQCPSSVSFRAGPKHLGWGGYLDKPGLSTHLQGWKASPPPQQTLLTMATQLTICLATVCEKTQATFKLFQHLSFKVYLEKKKKP